MYTVDMRDEVVILEGLPGHSAGAPMPTILANDIGVVPAYETAPQGEQFERPTHAGYIWFVCRFRGARKWRR